MSGSRVPSTVRYRFSTLLGVSMFFHLVEAVPSGVISGSLSCFLLLVFGGNLISDFVSRLSIEFAGRSGL